MRKILGVTALLAMAGCGATSPGGQSFYREAGSNLDGGYFGNATMNNTQIMSGERSFVYSLANRFAQEVPSTVNFAFNSSTLDAGARDSLREQARWIRQFPEVRFRVYGHTDLVGSNAYNKRLGLKRAQAVVSFLASQGISRSRLEAVASFGETQPLIVTQGRERRNRRTVTEVTGFVKNHPALLDGKYAQVIYREYVNSGVPATTLSGIENSVTDGAN
ncbi:OmpA family protein [Rhodalgimonas zhirmunskyi]|uniref:OmpA family protein n=1 Tax=Rhodalgimonas zhirmunskyi TaxID=2964767 RepID=A0AAJ1U519_9RHOB|nr:OmpA family protein [Rhodoalgimonas zhirmunskyi]MDQ2093775.1 OmpA family protein [Rhodoalgimonas zhirmunskyi]